MTIVSQIHNGNNSLGPIVWEEIATAEREVPTQPKSSGREAKQRGELLLPAKRWPASTADQPTLSHHIAWVAWETPMNNHRQRSDNDQRQRLINRTSHHVAWVAWQVKKKHMQNHQFFDNTRKSNVKASGQLGAPKTGCYARNGNCVWPQPLAHLMP